METKRSCIIIDDEPKAISVLSNIISKIPELDLKASFDNPLEALVRIADINPDIVFSDIEMPHRNGFELVDEIRMMGLKPFIVFTTGYDQYAIKAIKKHAMDYLLKPITKSDILLLLTRANFLYNKDTRDESNKATNGKIRFNTLSGFYVIEVSNIAYVQADGNYSELHMKNGAKKLVTSNLARTESLLVNFPFKRIGRSLIINIDCLTQVDRKHAICILDTGTEQIKLPINRKKIKELSELF
ncbi:MAG: response regulator transcription factor [Bacteroidales bacterium]|nr:response regulator transcription factor [Bacteroidales bacterium]